MEVGREDESCDGVSSPRGERERDMALLLNLLENGTGVPEKAQKFPPARKERLTRLCRIDAEERQWRAEAEKR